MVVSVVYMIHKLPSVRERIAGRRRERLNAAWRVETDAGLKGRGREREIGRGWKREDVGKEGGNQSTRLKGIWGWEGVGKGMKGWEAMGKVRKCWGTLGEGYVEMERDGEG